MVLNLDSELGYENDLNILGMDLKDKHYRISTA